ncbi:hypothetical protein PHIN3_166 [Sinorhizobium phage phiN3]|uniref:Uncharacterized protein n=1 Tax=Sinorhizobium phage phiN3 TaxID=1647405 RepID=A0A0F6YPQ0_9CAUD|nr:hypothetical protein AVT40_gp367 [Sinorhizobium phage phiN3]AKF13429.1 hypothetical protein PHIN3_166 [Sinorhizobium phage phiN3]
MTTELITKAGYYVKVTSWENDADNYQTVRYPVTDHKVARTVLDFVKLFRSKNNGEGGIGNIYSDYSPWAAAIIAQFHNEHPGIISDVGPVDLEDEDALEGFFYDDGVSDFLGALGLTSADFFTRVADNARIEFYPEDVYAYVSDKWSRR